MASKKRKAEEVSDESEDESKEEESQEESEEEEKKKAPAKKKATRKAPAKKRKKDPNAPKGVTTAYMFYSKEKRLELQAKHKGIKFGDLSKMISKSWKTLSEEEKKQYNEMHEKDKERHRLAMKTYVKPDSSNDSESSDDSSSKKKKKPKKKRAKKEKDPNAPKPAANAYMLFQKERRNEIKSQNPNLKAVTEIAKKLGEIWRGMTDEEKKKYSKQAEQDKERFKKEMDEYKKAQAKEKAEEKDDEEEDEEDNKEEESSN